ncbi:AraC family transcriptional regulator [Acaryochloris marina]|uniref:AraC family transcriptional regulator n=1 Tax=Acaryochloris marina TaxID=155978 RepID=UPI0021C3729B|nr:AraC family transcriptional regulator [Acaryochloris marina]BDM83769.1 AraC family transcriptional regulator [Acaryochloris marina MBIC10699]
MIDGVIHRIDCSQEKLLENLLSKQPDFSSYGQNWNGINMFVNRIGPIEIPEFICLQHTITIPTHSISSLETTIDGKLLSGSLYKGDIMLDPAQVLIHQRLHEVAEGIVLHLEPSLLRTIAADDINPDSIELLQTQRREDALVSNLGFALWKILEVGQPCQMYAEAVANFLAAHLLQNYATKKFSFKEYTGGLSPRKLAQVLDYIDAHLSDDLSIKTLASISELSPYYFSRLFKQSKGCSPHQYILRKRVEQAKYLLRNSNLSIADIALTCGFAHQSHLNRYFKRIVGVTPREYLAM